MPQKNVITSNQVVWMLFSIITSFTALQVPGILIFHAGRDSWLSVVIAWLLDTLLALVYAYMAIRFPGQNFVQYSITILGNFFGRILGILFPVFFLMTAAILMRSIGILVNTIILPFTPKEVVILSGFIIVAYAVKKGIETTARASEILGPIYFISFILLFILVSPFVKLNNLKPQLVSSPFTIFSGAVFILSFIGICIMMGMYIPISNHTEDGFKTKFIAVSLGGTVISLLSIFSIGLFGSTHAGNKVNPGLMLTRMIQLGSQIDRIDIIWIIIAIEAGVMTTINLIWAASLGLSQAIGLESEKNIIYPVILVAAALGICSFDSSLQLFNFAYYVFPFIGFSVETGLEMFLFIMALILKKRGSKDV